MRILTPSEPAEKKTLSEQALTEFRVAVDIWTKMMDPEDIQAALAYMQEKTNA